MWNQDSSFSGSKK